MIDPDAPSPGAPTASAILHWMAPDLAATTAPQDFGPLQGQSVLMNSTPNVAPYLAPGPPPASSAHRYLLFLFAQPAARFAVPPAFAQFGAAARANFDLNAFVAAAGLAPPLAANFMYVSGQQAVAPDFQGPPFGTFPGGNGNAVGLPGSTAVPAGGSGLGPVPANGTMGTANGTMGTTGGAAGSSSSSAGGSMSGSTGQTTIMGMGEVNAADGSCTCSVACPAGSFPSAVAT